MSINQRNLANPSKKFAVINRHGDAETNLSKADAAQIILNDDGCDYEIRRSDNRAGFDLWTRQQVANIPWTRTVIYSFDENEDAAKSDIFAKVLRDSSSWAGHTVITMAEYEKMVA
jgi:hypothetical protein